LQKQARPLPGFFLSFPSPITAYIFTQKEQYGKNHNHPSQPCTKRIRNKRDSRRQTGLLLNKVHKEKNGELAFIPRAVAAGLPFSAKDKRMRGVLPFDSENNASGHITPVHIEGINEWNGKKIKM